MRNIFAALQKTEKLNFKIQGWLYNKKEPSGAWLT